MIYLVSIILFFSGWFEELVSKIGTKKGVLFFLLSLLIFSFFSLPFLFSWEINIGGYLLPYVAAIYLFITRVKTGRLYTLTSSLLLGAVYFLLKELIRLDPVILFVDEIYLIPILLVVITALIVPDIIQRIFMITFGMLTGEFLFHYQHLDTFTYVLLGNGHFRDLLWISVGQTILLHYSLEMFKHLLKEKKLLKILRDKVRINE